MFELQAATDTAIAKANKPKLNDFFIVVLSKSYLNDLSLIHVTQKGNPHLNKKIFSLSLGYKLVRRVLRVSKNVKRSALSDNEIISGILNDSKLMLNQLYQSFFPMVLQLVLSNNGDEDDAKDIFQESLIILYDKVKAGKFELSCKLKTFIYSICRRLWLKKLNHKSRNTLNIKDFEDFIPLEEDLEQHEKKDLLFQHMEKSLGQLGNPCRTIIEDYYIQNKSMQEISDKFGYTNADNAKTQKYKCLQRLKKIFFQKQNG